uniref:DUF4220 domain-containing protein n=1 Tax=Setaria italica TaxID=4555 RepID=K3ZHJ8_SETIT
MTNRDATSELMEAQAMVMAIGPKASVVAAYLKALLRMVMTLDLVACKVIAASVIWVILRQLQSVLGPRRRLSGHWLVQYGAMAAYYLPTLIAFYTANAVYSSNDIRIILSMVCCVLLFCCARGPVTMTAFTLDHGPRRLQSWRLLPWLLYFAWLQWVFLDCETKTFADYMVRESRSSSPFFDGELPDGLHDGCKYPFKLRDGRWINFSDVLQHHSRLPTDCAVDTDICLSYSFCRLLARRYFGFPCPEDGNPQVREFVLTELLADCNRAFTIVEVQLALLHDYFFTNYHSDITYGFVSSKQVIVKLARLSLLSLACFAAAFLMAGLVKGFSGGDFSAAFHFSAARLLLLLSFTALLVLFYWHPIRNLFLYYPAATGIPSGFSDIDRTAAPHNQNYSRPTYWREKMGQYSVMEDYDSRSSKKAIIAWCKVHVLSQVSYGFIKHHPVEEEDVSVPDSLRMMVARTIKDTNGPPTMGTRSLRVHDLGDDLSWTCTQETLTHTILIWHIATCCCDMSQPLEEEITPQQSQDEGMSQLLEEPSTGYRKVATTLSRYCAYLVAFLPELLPEHSLTAKVVLQQVLQEPKDLLGSTRMSMEAKRSKIQELELPEEDSSLTTFQKGVRLGRQLEQQVADVSLRWKTMADFWVEMILYVASSSDNATAHVEQLAQGGEFVTHLWALLCNAGIVMKRAAEEPATS